MKKMTPNNNKAFAQSKREQINSFSDRKSYSALTGIFYSTKCRRIVYYESSLERDFSKILEFDQKVINYLDHPFTINYTSNGKMRTYTPDFLVEFNPRKMSNEFQFLGIQSNSSKWIVEIKYQEKINSFTKEEIQKYDDIRKTLKQNNYDFHIINESIRNDYFQNVKKLLRLNREYSNVEMENKITTQLKGNINLTISELIKLLGEYEKTHILKQVQILLLNRKIVSDLSIPLSFNSKLKLP